MGPGIPCEPISPLDPDDKLLEIASTTYFVVATLVFPGVPTVYLGAFDTVRVVKEPVVPVTPPTALIIPLDLNVLNAPAVVVIPPRALSSPVAVNLLNNPARGKFFVCIFTSLLEKFIITNM